MQSIKPSLLLSNEQELLHKVEAIEFQAFQHNDLVHPPQTTSQNQQEALYDRDVMELLNRIS